MLVALQVELPEMDITFVEKLMHGDLVYSRNR